MKCSKVRKLVYALSDGLLRSDEDPGVAALEHIERCAKCRMLLAEARRTSEALRAPVEIPAGIALSFDRKGVIAKIMMGDKCGWSEDIALPTLNDPASVNDIDYVSGHYYCGNGGPFTTSLATLAWMMSCHVSS